MRFLILIFISTLLSICMTDIYAENVEDYKAKLLNEVNDVITELKNINNDPEECENAYIQIHQCPLSAKVLTNYDDLCDNLNRCNEIFKDVDSLKNTLTVCGNSDEENQLIFEKYHNKTDIVTQHLEAYCYFDEQGQLCPLSKSVREDDELTNIMVVNTSRDIVKYLGNIKYYPKRRLMHMDVLKENCYSKKCQEASLRFIQNIWDEINYLTLEDYNLKEEQINLLSNEACTLSEEQNYELEFLKSMEEELNKLEQLQQVSIQEFLEKEQEKYEQEIEKLEQEREQLQQLQNLF